MLDPKIHNSKLLTSDNKYYFSQSGAIKNIREFTCLYTVHNVNIYPYIIYLSISS